jgi:dihydrofolate synthase/folylpolyglutamate synthase
MSAPRTWREALDFFTGLPASTIKLGLARMEAALEALGHPERQYPAVHVAGTNGKGSTCALLAQVLQESGLKVGLYTSPHLLRPNERIRVNGLEIGDEALGERILEVLERCEPLAADLTYFEMGTLVGFLHFAREQVDLAVVETGLGGRLDATRACVPWVTAVTSLSLDHTEYLGPTLEHIAREKAGIFKPEVPAVTCRQPPGALAELRSAARAVGAPLFVEGEDFGLEPSADGLSFSAGPRQALEVNTLSGLSLGLPGPHQRQNAAVAVASLRLLQQRGLPVTDVAIARGLARARWPGRLEVLSEDPLVIVDGAHNPGGAQALAQALDALYPGRKLRLVFGVLREKDVAQILEPLLSRCSHLYLCPPQSPRALAPEMVREQVAALAPRLLASTTIFPSVEAALLAARQGAGDDVVLAAGSLVLVGEARRVMGLA